MNAMNAKIITLHHSLTKDSGTVSWQAIRRYHEEINGWSAIGYHYGIELINDRYEVLLGRMPNQQGAHVRYHNTDNIGVCLVGDFDNEKPPGGQWNLALELVRYLIEQYDLDAGAVKGHREFNPEKSCPGRMFDLEMFRAEL